MTPPLYIALRFLGHRKRAFILSLSGVVFGVAIFICTQAQTQGFAQNFIDSTLGSNGALVLRSRFEPRAAGLMVPPKSSARSGTVPRRHYLGGITNAREIMRVSRQFATSPPARRSCAARSARAPASRMPPSIFSGSSPLSISKPPIWPSRLSPGASTIFAIIRTRSLSVRAWPTRSR